MAGFCGGGNEYSVSVKCREFLEYVMICQFLRDSAPWSYLAPAKELLLTFDTAARTCNSVPVRLYYRIMQTASTSHAKPQKSKHSNTGHSRRLQYRSFKLGGGIAVDCPTKPRYMRDAVPYARRLSDPVHVARLFTPRSYTCSYSEDLLV